MRENYATRRGLWVGATRKMLQPMKMTLPAMCRAALASALIVTAAFAVTWGPSANAQVAAPGTAPVQLSTAKALAPGTGPSYTNRWEIYGGLLYANGQAGQNLPKHFNAGGGEVEGTYWLGGPGEGYLRSHLGVSADVRFDAGTTPLSPNQYNLNRVLVQQYMGGGGVSLRGPKNRYVAIDYHGFGGVTHGVFDHAIVGYPPSPQGVAPPTTGSVGLYSNRSAAWAAAGGSIDFNQGKKWAVRLSPDITFEHYGTELREFFSISGGVLYRFGKK